MGARGFIPKSASGDVMVNSLRLVLSGGVCLPPGYHEPQNGDADSKTPNLTQRQMEVLRLMAKGSSNKEIARDLSISENTVRVHISAVIGALEATNRTEAAYLFPHTIQDHYRANREKTIGTFINGVGAVSDGAK